MTNPFEQLFDGTDYVDLTATGFFAVRSVLGTWEIYAKERPGTTVHIVYGQTGFCLVHQHDPVAMYCTYLAKQRSV